MATIGEQNIVLYRGVALSKGLADLNYKRVYLGLSEVATTKPTCVLILMRYYCNENILCRVRVECLILIL